MNGTVLLGKEVLHTVRQAVVRTQQQQAGRTQCVATLSPLSAGQMQRAGGSGAHLGKGASLCGMRDGRSVDSSMGFTALDGLVMGTRCGTLDPGVALYLLQQRNLTPDALEDLLYRKSGLLGVSGISSDMRVLEASDDPRADDAIASFVHRIVRESGAVASVMGGLDGFVFTAGIGENAPGIRRAVCQGLAWLGLSLDEAANRAEGNAPRRISAPDSRISVWVIPTDEEAMIVEHAAALVTH